MCGIAGFVSGDERADARAVLARMLGVITHRGPDDEGSLVEGPAAIGMRRLSIIDLAGGHQPLSGCDPALSVVFNGEIYNFLELRPMLEARGHRFRTHSDTEAIVHAYEEFGPACVEHLRGMFAFALWDARARRLFIARDRAGEKPLYYTLTPEGTFVFGSELKCLLEHPEARREVDPAALDAYLTFGYVPDPLSIFRGVEKLPPGHALALEGGRVTVRQYWDFTYEPVADARPVEDYLEELRTLLDESVRMRLIADVPLGAFLSGGVDSSAVVGLMARASDRPVKTFSIGFHEDSYNELRFARVAAQEFKTDHHEFIVTPEICSVVDELVWHFDEPFADSSAIPTYVVSKMAREHVKVVLSGDGGDELFAGYTRYVTDRQRSGFARLPRFLRKNLMQPLGRALPHGARGRNFIHNVAYDPLERYVEHTSVFTRLSKLSLYSEGFRALSGGGGPVRLCHEHAARVRTGEQLDRVLYLDSKTYLPGDILTKVDRMSMAVSLEARVPLLDHKLIEFVTRIPAEHKLRGLETKHVFKRAVRGLVPDQVLDRPKQGFGVPIDRWINERLRERVRGTLEETRTRQRGLFEQSYVRLLLDEHERGRRDHAHELWALFMLELWQRAFVDDAGRAARARAEAALAPAVF